jgi:hypothetical protein
VYGDGLGHSLLAAACAVAVLLISGIVAAGILDANCPGPGCPALVECSPSEVDGLARMGLSERQIFEKCSRVLRSPRTRKLFNPRYFCVTPAGACHLYIESRSGTRCICRIEDSFVDGSVQFRGR